MVNTGVLGHGDEKNRSSPTIVENLYGVSGIACGAHHIFAWCHEPADLAYSWGLNGR